MVLLRAMSCLCWLCVLQVNPLVGSFLFPGSSSKCYYIRLGYNGIIQIEYIIYIHLTVVFNAF